MLFISSSCCISFDSYIKPQLSHRCPWRQRVVYLLIPTSNHNLAVADRGFYWLYIFWFLHQTTTANCCHQHSLSCISFDSYIKPQRPWWFLSFSYVVYLLIPTSNHNLSIRFIFFIVLYIFWFLHQTTTLQQQGTKTPCCISFDSYIKPQPERRFDFSSAVVYLLIPTSNHDLRLSLISLFWLYIFWFLHQTTTWLAEDSSPLRCISFDSYIKPQPPTDNFRFSLVVYLLIPTSNHNSFYALSYLC